MELLEAIENLYEVFLPYSPGEWRPPSGEAYRLRELTNSDLDSYRQERLIVSSDSREFRHLLPKLLECLCQQVHGPSNEPGLVFSSIRVENWRDWPIDEQEAIDVFLHAWWHNILVNYPSPRNPTDVLIALGRIEAKIASFLSEWSAMDSSAALRHFVESTQY